MAALIPKPISVKEYLEIEQNSAVRHEFVSGTMYAMAGTSRRHNLIASNIFGHLLNLARSKSCRVYHADMRLRVGDDYYYPDAMVVCGHTPDDEYHETDPCILVEVLSDSTKNIDLREKALAYQHLDGLQTYLVIDPNSKTVRHFSRNQTGEWQHTDITSGSVALPCLAGSISLEDIYRELID
jgi:Uma2 family endonuclease